MVVIMTVASTDKKLAYSSNDVVEQVLRSGLKWICYSSSRDTIVHAYVSRPLMLLHLVVMSMTLDSNYSKTSL